MGKQGDEGVPSYTHHIPGIHLHPHTKATYIYALLFPLSSLLSHYQYSYTYTITSNNIKPPQPPPQHQPRLLSLPTVRDPPIVSHPTMPPPTPLTLIPKPPPHVYLRPPHHKPFASLSPRPTPLATWPRRALPPVWASFRPNKPTERSKPAEWTVASSSLHTLSHTKRPVPQGPINPEGEGPAHPISKELGNEMRGEKRRVHESERADLQACLKEVRRDIASLREEIGASRRREDTGLDVSAPPLEKQISFSDDVVYNKRIDTMPY